MASQQPAPRQWFRLPSIVRPVLPPTQIPEARPTIAPPAFRPMGPQPQPTRPPEPTPAPIVVSGVSSAPSSPIKRTSVQSPPVQKTSPTPTVLPDTITKVTSPPKPQVSATSASLTSSPSPKPSPYPPKLSTSSMTTSPARPVLTSPPKPTQTSPARPTLTSPARTAPASPPKPETTVVGPTAIPRRSPKLSPRTLMLAVRSPPESPKTKPTAPPPSPLILPPPQLNSKVEIEPKIPAETEQKTVLVQTTTEKPKSWLYGTEHHNDFDERHKPSSGHHVKHELSRDIFGKKEKGHRKKFSSDSDELGMRVITISGENKGAFMEVIKSPMKHNFDGNSHNLYPQTDTKWHSFISNSSSSDEGNSKKKDKSKNGKAIDSPPMGAFTNSNVQGINNSIVFKSSCSHHDPGVHLSLSRKPLGPGIHVQDKTNGHHS